MFWMGSLYLTTIFAPMKLSLVTLRISYKTSHSIPPQLSDTTISFVFDHTRPPATMDSTFIYQMRLKLLDKQATADHYEAVLYQNMYFVFRWGPESPYGGRYMTTLCNIGVSALMNALKGTWIDSAIIVYVSPIIYYCLIVVY